MPEEKKPEARRRRLKGQKLGELRAMMKKLERAVKSLNGCRDDILDAHGAFSDQINWATGTIYDVGEKVEDRTKIGRITKEEETRERQLRREVESIDGEIGDLKWELAEKLGCLPGDIDPMSGQITGTPVDGVDPDAPEEESQEDEVPAAAGKSAIPIKVAG